ncbi:MAG: ATP-dependent sacrificial sulfur transferase LarE [Deltaproteobacteria bacterium]|nr:ATP-dependent sacrificial sulfur transferase LarE [Deltaproteobacteria bacterium]
MDKRLVGLKRKNLVSRLEELGSLLVAFSGGVDSTFLLALAHEALGENAVAATSTSILHPLREREEASNFTRKRGILHVLFQSDEMGHPEIVRNGPDRCYHCKKILFQRLFAIAEEKGLKHVAHAANVDDLGDFRPGFKAAQEAGVIAPLIEAQLNKEEIRFLSREMGLPSWDKPAMACLASRIPYGNPITEKKLKMIEDAETFLLKRGIRQVRVRRHGSVARIEVGRSDLEKIIDKATRGAIVERLREIGFDHVSLDLEGFVSGSMNRILKNKEKEPVKESRE